MREIKFRAWLKETNYMRYDFDAIAWRNWRGQDFEDLHIVDFNFIEDDFEKATVMQYTGLKDKNGKEIYEGDILNVIAHLGVESFMVKVEWDNDLARFFTGNSPLSAYSKQSEIIGNIYENQELLK